MKKTLLHLFFTFTATCLFAQTPANDSVSLGAGYTDDVFYSMQSGLVATSAGNNWHIALSTRPAAPPFNVMRSATVLANEGRGVSIFRSTQTDWSTFDTTGYMSWDNPHNSDSTWDIGAFNAIRSVNPFDFGWGTYNMQTHDVEGSAIFLVQMSTRQGPNIINSFKKISIEKLAFDTQWVFTYSNLDGTDSMHVVLSKSAYTGKMFAYYDLKTHVATDREPSAPWDLLFTRYGTFVTQFGVTAFSATTGVLQHPSVSSAKVTGNHEDSLKADMAVFSNRITTIGTDWKENPGPGQPNFIVHDSTVYFVKPSATALQYRLVFRSFEGSSTGKITFFKDEENILIGLTENKTAELVRFYPNPASTRIMVETEQADRMINIFDFTGKLVITSPASGTTSIDISNLNKGFYFIQAGQKTARLVIE